MKFSWRILHFLLFVGLAGFFWVGLGRDPAFLPSNYIGKRLPAFNLPILGESTASFSPKAMLGENVLLNIWASWCAACSEEQYFLLKLKRQGYKIYGINYKDNTKRAVNWLKEWGNPYQLVAEDLSGKVAIDLGVYGAPELFLIDKNGIVRYRHAGIMNQTVWENEFLPRLKPLEKNE